ncbi:cytochrome c biogenesis protein CcsA [Pseudoalteromonas sp. BDTF-M6]|uniref:cytochrome C assembly family protein n=1 Tax=Pseudoalteromonas sp. BDTF-M6 TaxID=2796132 RepID=UPI001BAFBBC3|nr:cytochrome c biogenesis protein CcsA [Pseudoalteromonas sp. BDTF-M6]MBS3796246.1 cytochrome c biogenesis protein CcsA [Pseudoalteromonas sp. BDTF-M6]
MLITVLTLLSCVFYAAATAHVLSRLFHAQGPSQKATVILSTLAILTHMVLLVNSVFTNQGQDVSFINVSLLTCWVIVLSVTAVSLKFPATLLLPVVYGFAAILLFASLFMPHHMIVQNIHLEAGLVAHITLSLLAYCILIIATLYAVQFYFIDKRLKRKDLAIVYSHLPPLMVVERQLYQLVTVGTALLTIALLSGFIFVDTMISKDYAHKTILSLLAWAIFAAVVFGRHLKGWRGKSSVLTIMVGAALLTLAYFGSRFVQEVILHRF